MATVIHIHADTAREIHRDLLEALGTENVPNQWMHFMASVRRHLPEVLSRGRPSRQVIEASVIGALGFGSWRAMVEAPTVEGGLGLGWSTWRQWSRAWVIIAERPALHDAPLTAAEVNRLASQAKAADLVFPADPAGVAALEARLAERRAEARANTLQGLRERIAELEQRLAGEAGRANALQARLRRFEGATLWERLVMVFRGL